MENYILPVSVLTSLLFGFTVGYLVRWRQLRIRLVIERVQYQKLHLTYLIVTKTVDRMTDSINAIKFDHEENEPENLGGSL